MILVVGGAGYIGSHMVETLRNANESHVVFDSLESGHRSATAGSPFVQGDLRNLAEVERLFDQYPGIDVVVHFAAYISVGESVREPNKYYRNNFGGTLNLVDAMRKRNINKLVFSSTAAVYGNPQYVPLDEEHPKLPINPYGKSKLMVEELLLDAETAFGLRSVCLRYFNAAGSDPNGAFGEDHDPEEHLIPNALLAALGKKDRLLVFGDDYPTADGTCVRDYVHVSDLAEAHLLAVRHLRAGGESKRFNLGNGRGFSVKEVMEVAAEVTGRNIPHEYSERRPGDSPELVADSRLIQESWGWSPKYPDLRDIIRHAWEWRKANPDGFGD